MILVFFDKYCPLSPPTFVINKKLIVMKTKLLILSILLVASFGMQAQSKTTNTKKESFKHGIGVGAGFTTGNGISYRYMPEKFGIQTTLGFLATQDDQYMSAGVTFIYKIVDAQFSDLYLFQGNSLLYNKYVDTYTEDNYDYSETTNSINNSIGFGVEITLLKRLSANFMIGYASYNAAETITVTGETAFYYKF